MVKNIPKKRRSKRKRRKFEGKKYYLRQY